ncbi:MAG: pyridoxine 5'-phosphate synthase [Verrucomicrobia bacterium]|nr:pyridoxine 5'-phosphate synthase [Verrucomicrobiota bacterium]
MKLGVNIDHVATLREARYRDLSMGEPDPVEAALMCERAGAHGITIHVREDRRHIQERDAWAVRARIQTRLNLEMANTEAMLSLALRLKPDITCLVPEKREEVTTEGGLDARALLESISTTVSTLKTAGIQVSLFISPEPEQVDAAARSGAEFIELHTGTFAEHFSDPARKERELARLIECAKQAKALGLRVNAGHGLNYQNVDSMHHVPFLEELNIGHSIVSRSIAVGMEAAVREMLDRIRGSS